MRRTILTLALAVGLSFGSVGSGPEMPALASTASGAARLVVFEGFYNPG